VGAGAGGGVGEVGPSGPYRSRRMPGWGRASGAPWGDRCRRRSSSPRARTGAGSSRSGAGPPTGRAGLGGEGSGRRQEVGDASPRPRRPLRAAGRVSSGRRGGRQSESSLGSDRSSPQRVSGCGSAPDRRAPRPRPSRPRSGASGADAAYQSGRSVRGRGAGVRASRPGSRRSPPRPASGRGLREPAGPRRSASHRSRPSPRSVLRRRSSSGPDGARSSSGRSRVPARSAASGRGLPRPADRRTRSRSRSAQARASSAAADRSRGGGCDGLSVDPLRTSGVPAAGFRCVDPRNALFGRATLPTTAPDLSIDAVQRGPPDRPQPKGSRVATVRRYSRTPWPSST
jgi:hypothetical protein